MVGLCRLVVDASSFRCESCHKPYMSMTGIIDLTISGGAQDLEEALPSGVALFQSVFFPYIYCLQLEDTHHQIGSKHEELLV